MRIFRNQNGGAAIAFILFASVGAAFLATNLNTLLDIVSKKKKEGRLNAEMDTFTRGVIAYTSYALKERWCMDNSWARSDDCTGDMDKVISNKFNLERLLWSSASVTAIKKAYYNEYNREINFEPSLEKIEAKISISSLESLGQSHPLNLSLTNTLRNCMKDILIRLKKAENSSLYSSGDDRFIEIYVEGIMKSDKSCSNYKSSPYGKSLVGLFPRTLNQFAVIKGGDFDLSKINGSKSSRGLNIHAPVYVDNNLIVPKSGYSPVALYSNVYVGRGGVKFPGKDFSPKSFGGNDDQLYSTYKHVKSLKRGVVLEGEVDEGIAALFGNEYYVDTSLAKKCDIWRKLEDNMAETRDSRLFGRKNSGGFSIGLSKTELAISNEFREYAYPSEFVSEEAGYIQLLSNPTNTVSYINKGNSKKPIMKMDINVLDNNESAEVLLARDSSININLNSDINFIKSKEVLEKDSVERNEFEDLYKENEFQNAYDRHAQNCSSFSSNYQSVRVGECSLVNSSFNDYKDKSCAQAYDKRPKRKESCEKRIDGIKKSYDDYQDLKNASLVEIENSIAKQPSITLDLSAGVTNITNFAMDVKNPEQLKLDGYRNIQDIELRFWAFDFAVENSSNPISGRRHAEPHKPGPNDASNPNVIKLKINRELDGTFSSVSLKNSEGKELNSWTLLKNDFGRNEPPHKLEEGSFGRYSNEIYIPEDGLTLSESEELEEKCSGVPTNDNFQWDISFTKNTLHSWMYDVGGNGITLTGEMVMQDLYTFNENNMYPGNAGGIPNQSITKKCVIPSNVDFIFGFYACDELVIEGRSSRLTFVGTLLVNKFNISNTAINTGIDFYNIWHPVAVEKLRKMNWLARRDNEGNISKCKDDVTVWDKNLTNSQMYDMKTCSPIHFVLEGPNNYNWTTVDPEIGLPDDGGIVTKSKIPNRYRRFNLQTYWVATGSK